MRQLLVLALLLCVVVGAVADGSSRLSPALQALSRTASDEAVPVMVVMRDGGDVSSLLQHASVVEVAGLRLVRGRASARVLAKLAQAPGVEAVLDAGPRPVPPPPDPDVASDQKPMDRQRTRQALRSAPAWKPLRRREAPKPPTETPDSWWGNGFIGVHEAWDLGFDGAGVNVAVMDTGVDFAHPDLEPAIARVNAPTSPHHGWPICFDGYAMTRFAVDGPITGSRYVSTSAPPATVFGATAAAQFTIWKKDHYETHRFTFWNESVSGVYRFGLHPDLALVELLGQYAAVLVVDTSDVAGRGPGYNTVYVDLDADYDFTDEKPCYRGDEVSWRDVWDAGAHGPGSDGLADISGGMVYFIANGVRPIPAGDWLYNLPVPAPGTLVAFMIADYSISGGEHGTQCAGSIAARGIINGNPPAYKPPYAGPGDGMVQGPARGAGIIAIGDYYQGGYYPDYYLFCALGYDGVPRTGDEPNIVSMSFGSGGIDNDGWNYESRLIDWIGRTLAPEVSWLVSSGNGAPGYMTITSPAPPRGVKVGASTEYGSTTFLDPVMAVEQILAGDVQSWSGAGPVTTGHYGPHVLANGAWGSGDLPLNVSHDGATAWNTWGGTSRSCPEAAGVLALIYQAFNTGHQRWPTADEAKAILLNSAVDQHYDIFRQGAGRVHAGRGVRLAAASDGLSVDPAEWWVGDYRGTAYDAYARTVAPGQVVHATFTLINHGAAPLVLDVSGVIPSQIGMSEFTMQTVQTPNEDHLASKPDYLYLLEGPGAHNIPAHTDLMTLDAVFPFADFDLNYVPGATTTVTPSYESGYRLLAYDWMDRDGDSKLYDDNAGSVPGVVEQSEIDSGEYVRFNYGYTGSTSLKCYVREPLARMHDGIFVGLQHRRTPVDGHAAQVRVRARYFQDSACPWLRPQVDSIQVPAHGSAVLAADVIVPATQSVGCYGAKLLLAPRGASPTETLVVPVVVNVAAEWTGQSLVLGGGQADNTPYDNHHVRGDFSWGDRAESGDARLFFVDARSPAPGSLWFARTQWTDDLPTDVDTLIFGPVADDFTTSGGSYYLPAYGPNALAPVGGMRSPGRPDWLFSTSSGGPVDYPVAPVVDGLHAFFVHNCLFAGDTFDVPFRIDVGRLRMEPYPLQFTLNQADFVADVTLTSSLSVPDLRLTAYGPTLALTFLDQPIAQQTTGNVSDTWTHRFQTSNAALIDLILSPASTGARDVDLYLYRDGADGSVPDGTFRYPQEVVGLSLGLDSNERVTLTRPPDGDYLAAVYAYAVEGIAYFDFQVNNVQGVGSLRVAPSPPGELSPAQPKVLRLQATLPQPGRYHAYLMLGPGDSPTAIVAGIPIAFVYPGDVDGNGVVDVRDWLSWPRYWQRDHLVPGGLDVDGNGIFNGDDLARLNPPVRRKPGATDR